MSTSRVLEISGNALSRGKKGPIAIVLFSTIALVLYSVVLWGLAASNAANMEAHGANNLARLDLTAQQTMARYTMIMAWTGIGGLFIGVVTVLLLRQTLVETSQIGLAQTRAYIFAERASYSFGASKFEIEFKNYGNSPGRVKNLDIHLQIIDPNDPRVVLSEHYSKDTASLEPNGSQVYRFDSLEPLSFRDRKHFRRGNLAAEARVKFSVLDVFGHETKHVEVIKVT